METKEYIQLMIDSLTKECTHTKDFCNCNSKKKRASNYRLLIKYHNKLERTPQDCFLIKNTSIIIEPGSLKIREKGTNKRSNITKKELEKILREINM